ncbi:MAG: myo-inositol-1(or 4)-monophosphatase [Gammaproteobacteria bacterium]|jgi:myo-inositol-1(or 4)-monophosphatase
MPNRTLTPDDIEAIQQFVIQASEQSILPRICGSKATFKEDGSIVTEADLEMDRCLTALLSSRFPHIPILSEEINAEKQEEILNSGQDFWCLDPIDGTTNFHATMPLFSVSLALIRRAESTFGLIFDPVRGEMFTAAKGQGLKINGVSHIRPTQPATLEQTIAFVDFKRLSMPKRRQLIENTPYKSQRNIGTCALEWAWLAAGRSHLLIHGSEKLWDLAAGYRILAESGGISASIEGNPISLETLEQQSVLAASTETLFLQWSNFIQD